MGPRLLGNTRHPFRLVKFNNRLCCNISMIDLNEDSMAICLTFELLCSMNSEGTISSNFGYFVCEFVTSKWFCQLPLPYERQKFANKAESVQVCKVMPSIPPNKNSTMAKSRSMRRENKLKKIRLSEQCSDMAYEFRCDSRQSLHDSHLAI